MMIAIHQPNFFPWLGYFDKLARADRFIILDDAQFSKTGGTWSNRVQCLVGGKPQWITAPVDRATRSGGLYNQVRFQLGSDWREKILRTIEHNYRRASYFDDAIKLLAPLIAYDNDELTDYNINAILGIASALEIDCAKITRSSELPSDARSTERLIQLVQAISGSAYLCGGGAGGYQQDEMFSQAGIELRYQRFEPRPYPQIGSPQHFIPGLSVIDALLNIGVERTRGLLTGTVDAPLRAVSLG